MLRSADVEALAARGIIGVNVRTETTSGRLTQVADLVESGKVRPQEIRTFHLEDAGDALAEVGGHHVRGKLVVKI